MPGRSKFRQAGSRLRALLSRWRPALNLALAAGLITEAGCTRHYFRKKADKEVEQVLAQKDKYPDWKIENWWVYPDKRARFADPTNPDRPPKPPDDPAAYDLSPNPQHPGHAGVARVEGTGYLELIARWDEENRAALARRQAEEQKQQAAAEPGEVGEAGEEASAQEPQKPAPAAQPGEKLDVVAPLQRTMPPAPPGGATSTLLDISKRRP